MSDTNNFAKLAAIDVSKHIEKKQNLSYLSWAWAVDQLMRADPAANWTFHEPVTYGETMMVSCTVTAFGKPVTMHLPVMDHRNQAVKNPDAFVVNKNMMRCLVKAIACHGLGLYIYAGEDLPADEDGAPAQKQQPQRAAPAQKAPSAGPGLSEDSMEAVTVAMVEADDLDTLKKVFADAYPKANPEQQARLTKTKDEVKNILTTGVTA